MSLENEVVYQMPNGAEFSKARRDAYFTVKFEKIWDAVEKTLTAETRTDERDCITR